MSQCLAQHALSLQTDLQFRARMSNSKTNTGQINEVCSPQAVSLTCLVQSNKKHGIQSPRYLVIIPSQWLPNNILLISKNSATNFQIGQGFTKSGFIIQMPSSLVPVIQLITPSPSCFLNSSGICPLNFHRFFAYFTPHGFLPVLL